MITFGNVNMKGGGFVATAKQLKSGSWRVQTYKMVNGKPVRASITAPTKKEAERQAALWDAEQTENSNKKESLKEVLQEYIATCKAQGLSPSTLKEYISRANNSFPDLVDKKWDTIKTQDVQAQIDKRIETVSPKTIRNDLIVLKGALASRGPNINFNKLKIAKMKNRKKIIMKQEWKVDIPKKVVELYGKDDYYLYIILIIYAGLRPSESHALKWSDLSKTPEEINGTKIGYINVSKAVVESADEGFEEKETKTESGIRRVVVSWSLIEEITSVKQRGNDDERILKYNPYYARRWETLKKELDLPENMRRYDLRHFFATSLVVSGATEEELQEQMGHSSSSFSHSVYVEIMYDHKQTTTTKFAENSKSSIDQLKNIPTQDSGN